MYKICKRCGLARPHHGLEMCNSCYHTVHPRRVDLCIECLQMKPIWAKQMCEKCYRRDYARKAYHQKRKDEGRPIPG